ncbi:hypothetical protein J0S82_002723 [Galemys pyrenaicus]|uniref:Uncharacterized protein n=1 Tax=Galemys pyrenaicus TaxID=202257 RepID=A0A8J6DFJ6_GALPY|nr:hypothetical protein J0S82_002723 [Galemys pyrenaicus]
MTSKALLKPQMPSLQAKHLRLRIAGHPGLPPRNSGRTKKEAYTDFYRNYSSKEDFEETSINLLFGSPRPPTPNTSLRQRSLSRSRLTHPFTVKCPGTPGGGRRRWGSSRGSGPAPPEWPRAPEAGRDPSPPPWQSRLSAPGAESGGPRRASRAALPGAAPQPTCLSRQGDPLPAHRSTNGWAEGNQEKPRRRGSRVAHAGSGLHVSTSLRLQLQLRLRLRLWLRLRFRPGRLGAEAGRRGEEREAARNEAKDRTARRAPAGGHVARSARGRVGNVVRQEFSVSSLGAPPEQLQSHVAKPISC